MFKIESLGKHSYKCGIPLGVKSVTACGHCQYSNETLHHITRPSISHLSIAQTKTHVCTQFNNTYLQKKTRVNACDHNTYMTHST